MSRRFKNKMLVMLLALLVPTALLCTSCNNDKNEKPYVETATLVSTFDELKAAIEDTSVSSIKIKSTDESVAFTITETLYVTRDLVIDFNGETIASVANSHAFSFGASENSSTVVLKNGTLTAKDGGVVVRDGAKLTVLANMNIIANTGTYAEDGYFSAIFVLGKRDETYKTTLNVYGSVTSYNRFAIDSNGIAYDTNDKSLGGKWEDFVINIYNGATVTCVKNTELGKTNNEDMAAIYLPANGELNIMGGTVSGPTAVYSKNGIVNITGGRIVATYTQTDFQHSGSGIWASGDAVVVESCGYPGVVPTLNVSGGVIVVTDTNCKTIRVINYNSNGDPTYNVADSYGSVSVENL